MKTNNSDENKGSFVRWQSRTIEELGKAANLILTLSLATIGFTVVKLLGQFLFLSCVSKTLIILGSFVLLATALLILILMRNRINSMRITTQIARKREKNDTSNIENLRKDVRLFDKLTWILFNISVWLFIVGQCLTVIGFLIEVFKRQEL